MDTRYDHVKPGRFPFSKRFIDRESELKVQNWFQNLQSDLRSRRGEGLNQSNIHNISRIEPLAPTKRFGPRGGFELIPVMIRLIRPCNRHAEIIRLLL